MMEISGSGIKIRTCEPSNVFRTDVKSDVTVLFELRETADDGVQRTSTEVGPGDVNSDEHVC